MIFKSFRLNPVANLCTEGDFFVLSEEGDTLFNCNQLENYDRLSFGEKKIEKETAIPESLDMEVYLCPSPLAKKLNASLKIDRVFKEIEGRKHLISELALKIKDVDGFSQVILGHVGNSNTDTDGCILLGSRKPANRYLLFDSKKTIERFYNNVISKLDPNISYKYSISSVYNKKNV